MERPVILLYVINIVTSLLVN